MSRALTDGILASRRRLVAGVGAPPRGKAAEEGGCGVVGFAATEPLGGRILVEPARRMHNRGNGKGGGIAAAGLVPKQLGVDADTLRDAYLLQLALLDPEVEAELEREAVAPQLEILHKTRVTPARDHRELGLEVRPPDVIRYVVRVKDDACRRFAEEHDLAAAPPRAVEDEIVFQNSFRLNRRFYAAQGEKRAFVLSHSRDLLIFKVVGYAEQVVQYYGLDDFAARIWIAHQRYPTRGRVWHPAGCHPFVGMNEALVHNGDFANYHSVMQYLRQHHVVPQFLTDTEVAVLLYDLWSRVYGYPLEAVIEAFAPTTELDFDRLPVERQRIYRALSALHIHGSPDGPWFFIVAGSDPDRAAYRLLGITDTAMLRPQVFALQHGEVSIGIVASEKQAIDNTLAVLAAQDSRFRTVADRYWNARGGSYTDGGAFAFELQRSGEGAGAGYALRCTDKFGRPVEVPGGALPEDDRATAPGNGAGGRLRSALAQGVDATFEAV
ncbi:MAG: glutamate synthase, partial [bacterium]